MKTFKLLVFGLTLMLAGSVQSQLSVNVHIGTPPAWGPSGYNDVRYYYLPDVEAYYDVHTSMFIYISGNHWIRRTYLPSRYRNYDLYHGYKVVMKDYHGNSPYSYFRQHKMKYEKGYRGVEQRNNDNRNKSYYNNRARHQSNQPNRSIERSKVRNTNQNLERGNNKANERGNNKNENHGNAKNNGHDNGKGNGKQK